MTTLAFDKAMSFRWHDEDGRMHVDRSNLTRVQVAPYRGSEIPGWQEIGLDPDKVYYGYRPAEELGAPETIKSVIGIPIQLNHHLDYPDAPAMDTRVGSTGDQAKFDGTFLSNSLHIQNENACRLIRDGSMRQLSLAYRYDPDFSSSGEYNGQKYDFTMRNIRGQHLALVEEGRAGPTCVVEDHAFQEKKMDMDDKLPPTGANDDGGDDAVEKTEVEIADAMRTLADLLSGLHKTNALGETVDITEDEDKNAKIQELVGMFAKLGASEEDVKKIADSLADLAYEPDEGQAGAQDEDGECAKDEDEDLGQVARDALEACGLDAESPDFQRAFAEGVKYGERKEKEEPKRLDREHEREGEEKYLEGAQDAALVRRVKALEKREQIRSALAECKSVLGSCRVAAFDSADGVYVEALRQKGVSVKGINPRNARQLYLGVIQGESLARKRGQVASDSAMKSERIPDIAKGINVLI